MFFNFSRIFNWLISSKIAQKLIKENEISTQITSSILLSLFIVYVFKKCFINIHFIFTRIPLFIIGNSGTSKSTSLKFILKLFNENENELNLPNLQINKIECSQILSPIQLHNQFNNSEKLFQNYKKEIIPIIILKEFTNLKDKTLMTLNLEIEKIQKDIQLTKLESFLTKPSLILFSNQFSKMNYISTGIILNNELPNETELESITKEILNSFPRESPEYYFKYFVKIFNGICQNQKILISKQTNLIKIQEKLNKNFYGIYDYYFFLNNIGFYFSKNNYSIFSDILFNSLYRNFGIRGKILKEVLKLNQIDGFEIIPKFDLEKLITENLYKTKLQEESDQSYFEFMKTSRYLMLIISHISIFSIIYQKYFPDSIVIFDKDLLLLFDKSLNISTIPKEEKIKEKLFNIEYCISEGKILVIFDYQKIYPFLNNLLNQDFDEENGKFYTKIQFYNEERKVFINPKFRLVLVTIKENDYEFKEQNLLNHFEKHFIDGSTTSSSSLNSFFILFLLSKKSKFPQEN
ncbi:hypothetical protein M0811_13475 [Anaeramoeba ignava]|uniref:Uncharacterized protein n=1 Tax=Anaeramoeba ignava TaxID=1746090 RepID=A0A9Q0L8B8_ANAIG|nr:hypothetical protein M0811_13475 [Anaeramoeba ignava]